MENSTFLLVLTLSHGLRQRIKQFSGSEPQWELLARCLIEWTVCRFTSRAKDPVLVGEIKTLHDQFIKEHYYYLDQIDSQQRLQKAEWKKEDELWLHFSRGEGKNFPNWEKISGVTVPGLQDKQHDGALLIHPANSHVYYSEVTRMPVHATVQANLTLSLGIHANTTLQGAFNGAQARTLETRFIVPKENFDAWDFAKGFVYWWRDTRNGYPEKVEPEALVENAPAVAGKKSSHHDRPYGSRVNAGNRIYKNPQKCANGERIHPSQVYARIYSKSPQWTSWYFVGSDKDPR